MTVGNAAGGPAADRDLRRTVLAGFTGMVVTIAAFAFLANTPAGLFVAAFAVGATSFFLTPALQSLLITVAPGAQLMGAALNQTASNAANSIGAALGGLAIAAGYD